MVLRNDRRGVVSLVDAMIFVTILSLVSVSMFSFYAWEYQEKPLAKTVCEDFVSIELRASDVLDTRDSDVYPISDLLASGMVSGDLERLREYSVRALDDLVPMTYGYRMEIVYEGGTLTFARGPDGAIASEYFTEAEVMNGKGMRYHLVMMR